MKVLINGGGIAGLTLAYCLLRKGFEVALVEKSPGLRDDGYMTDLFGPGYTVAERMGMLLELQAIHFPVKQLTFVDRKGTGRFSLSYETLRKRLFQGRHFNLMRGELERVLYDRVQGKLPFHFGTTVESIEQRFGRVQVVMSDKTSCEVDLLVGADGVHSHIRELVFGMEAEFLTYLGHHAIAFTTRNAELVSTVGSRLCTLTVPGKQVRVYPLSGGRVSALFMHRHDDAYADFSPAGAVAELHATYAGLDWMVPLLVQACSRQSNVYFDAVSQVVMPHWRKGRVALIGDASHCVSMITGQNASLAMTGAYLLAQELEWSKGDVPAALARYEQKLRPVVKRKQRAGRSLARWFVPESSVRLKFRDLLLQTSGWPVISGLVRRGVE